MVERTNDAADAVRTSVQFDGPVRIETIRPNKLLLALLTTCAVAISLVPIALLLQHLSLLYWFVGGALLLSAITVAKFSSPATYSPRPAEFALGFVGALSKSASAAFGVLFFYWLVYWGIWVIGWIASWFGGDFGKVHETIAYWAGLSVGCVVVLVAARTAQVLARQLYPETAGIRSVFYGLVAFEHEAGFFKLYLPVILVVCVGVPTALLVPAVGTSWWYTLLLAWGLALVGAPFQALGQTVDQPVSLARIVDAVDQLFKVRCYEVVHSPRTGREDIDPLLMDTPDFYAQREDRAFAVEVRTEEEPLEEGSHGGVSDLSSAAWALGSFLNEDAKEDEKIKVEGLLVLVGIESSLSARIYRRQGLIRVLEIKDPKVLDRFLEMTNPEERREFAEHILKPSEIP